MQRKCLAKIALLIALFSYLQMPALSSAADAPIYDSPAAVVSAAEDAWQSGDFKAFADCFDAAGTKTMDELDIQGLSAYATFMPDTTSGKSAKALFAKYGVTDLSKQGDESDDHFAERIAGRIKDLHAFLVEATPIASPNPDHEKLHKGTLRAVAIDGDKAKATYAVNMHTNEMTNEMTFVREAGSWKIASMLAFAPLMD